jgi:histidyl-tRNA synthetase
MCAAPQSLAPPRGMRDFYPEAMAVRNAVFEAWQSAARAAGFEPYDACVVESLDLLKRKSGEEIVDQIYAFRDKSGRDLALRPEMTPTLARMVAARQGTLNFPIKWSTVAQCFRYERMTRGRKREHYQWNLDIIGEASPAAEVEVIATALAALRKLGLDGGDFRVRFSSRALLSELLGGLGLAPEHHAATFLALDKRGKLPDAEIRSLLVANGLDAAACDNVFALLAVQTLDAAAALLGRPDSPALANLRAFLTFAAACKLEHALTFDIGVVRGLAYYTGIVFEGFDARGELRAIFGGGRYDNLLGAVGGQPATGVGLGFGDVVIVELLADLHKTPDTRVPLDICIGFMQPEQQTTAIRLAATLRERGQCADLALSAEKPKKFFQRAGLSGAREAIYLGPDDITAGSVRIKTLADRGEREVALADLI